MSKDEVTKNIWRNSISNYICLALRVGVGVAVFRLLYQHLTKEEFGFWSLLWSLFGYGILLDFGLGFTAMKRVAELSASEDWDEVSRVLSTVFFFYLGISLGLIVVICLASKWLIGFFHVQPANIDLFRKLLIVFFCGMGIGFPFGIFPEVLIGLQRICLVNVIFSAAFLANAVLVATGIHFGWSMEFYMVCGLLSGIFPSVVSGMFAFRALPKVRVHPKFFSWDIVRKTTAFSIFAYINTVSGILLSKTDQLVLSTALAVSAVAIYQAGAKVAEMFGAFVQQLPDTFSPAAAYMSAKGDKAYLQKLLINGTRFSVMIATPVYFICAFYMEGLLKILTGDKTPSTETFWVGQVLALWCYMMVITQTVPRRIFMVSGHERRLMYLTLGEATLNLALSIGLVLHFKNVVCVAIGSLIATTLFGWGYIWPWAAREVNLSGLALARIVLLPTWLACLPLLCFVVLARFAPWLDFRTSTLLFIAQSAIAAAIGAVGLWRHALSMEERAALALKFTGIFNRRSVV